MKKIDDLEYIYHYLDDKHSQYLTMPIKLQKERYEIEHLVREFIENIDDELYLELNQGRASGLFEHGFFDSDMERALRILKQKIDSIQG